MSSAEIQGNQVHLHRECQTCGNPRYTPDHNNSFVYFDPTDDGRAVFVPWGADKTFYSEVDATPFVNAEVARRLSRIPEVAAMLEAELQRIMDEDWDEGALLALIDGLGAQVKASEENDGYDAVLDDLRDRIIARPGEVEDLIAAGLPVGSEEQGQCKGTAGDDGKDGSGDGKDGWDDGKGDGDSGGCTFAPPRAGRDWSILGLVVGSI